MATDGPVSRFDGVSYSGADERLLTAALLMPGATALSSRSGRRVGPGLDVSVSGLDLTVAAGAGVIYDAATGGGPWLWARETPKVITLGTRPGAGQSRKDLIVARIYTGGSPELKIEAVAGTPGADPASPALPERSVLIGTATVPASGTVTFVAASNRVVAAGGVLPVATTAERDALALYRGLVVDNAQTGTLQRYDGTTWKSLVEAGATVDDTGWIPLTFAEGYSSYDTAVFGAPAVRRLNGLVLFRGAVQKTSGNFATGTTTVATVPSDPAGLRPPARKDFQAAGSTSTTSKVFLGANGTVSVYISTPIPSYVSLADVQYFRD